MHHIQKKILESLAFAESLHYSQMRPKRVESNQFAYHLKQLIKDGLVEKKGSDYTLSPLGMAFVDKISFETFEARIQPKIVTLLDITTPDGETALLKRKHQPFYGKILFPTGKVHLGEKMLEAAQREAKEKLGLENLDLKYRGNTVVGVSQDGVPISQVLTYVFQATIKKEPLREDRPWFDCFWANAEEQPKEEFLAGFFEIKKLLEQDGIFYEELWYDI